MSSTGTKPLGHYAANNKSLQEALTAWGLTASATELNVLASAGVSTTEMKILGGLTANTTELNALHGAGISTTEAKVLGGVTASAAEINALTGASVSTTEMKTVGGLGNTITSTTLKNAIASGSQNWRILCGKVAVTASSIVTLSGISSISYAVVSKYGSTATVNKYFASAVRTGAATLTIYQWSHRASTAIPAAASTAGTVTYMVIGKQ